MMINNTFGNLMPIAIQVISRDFWAVFTQIAFEIPQNFLINFFNS